MNPITVSILTLTGYRRAAFELCNKYVLRQRALTDDAHYKFEWVVVDDGGQDWIDPISDTYNLTVKRIETEIDWSTWPARGGNTFNSNLELGLKHCTGELVAFMEDDDWYSPHYLLNMLDIYRTSNVKPMIIGSSPATYYNVRTGEYAILDNIFHASLAETIIHRSLIPICNEILSKADDGITFFDVQLWREARLKHVVCGHGEDFWLGSAGQSIGIKGMPGRRGIGVGHLDHPEWEQDDLNLTYLRSRIGDDANAYQAFRDLTYRRHHESI